MPSGATPPLEALEAMLPAIPRGPTRDGLFATWLTARVVLDLQLDPPLGERAARRRFDALEARFAKLRMPAPLRRALVGAIAQLREPGSRSATAILATLVAPVRDTLGPEPAGLVARCRDLSRPAAR
jgi:hypothetical protein